MRGRFRQRMTKLRRTGIIVSFTATGWLKPIPEEPERLLRRRTMCPMRWLLGFLLVLLLIGGGMKLAGMELPVVDYPLGGPMGQPQYEAQEPDLNLP